MSRAQRRMYRRARGQTLLKRALLALSALVILLGLASHLPGHDGFSAQPLNEPTATPVAAAFDETVTSREVSLPAQTWYAIQTGVYSTKDAALSRTGAYSDRGAPGYAMEDGDKWRVFIACYDTKSDATAVRERLNTVQKVDTHLHEWVSPAVTLRLSGMAGQLDVAEAGLMLPDQTAALLRDAAIALDAGEMTADAARQSVEAVGDRASLWVKTARERFAMPYPALISLAVAFADEWPARQAAILSAQNATELSAQMKLQSMAAYDDSVAMRRTLMQ